MLAILVALVALIGAFFYQGQQPSEQPSPNPNPKGQGQPGFAPGKTPETQQQQPGMPNAPG